MATTMRGPKPMKHGPRHTDECNEANDYSATERCICPPAPPLGATEGPWLLRYRGYQPDRRCIVTTSYEAEIADCGPALDLTAQANARLIAAAPTLLVALEGALVDGTTHTCKTACEHWSHNARAIVSSVRG